MPEASDRWQCRGPSLAAAGVFLIFSCLSAAASAGEEKEEIVVGANHWHSVDILTVTVIGRVPESGKKIGVTVKFSESEAEIERLAILYPEGKTIEVPRSYFEKVKFPQPRSLLLGYIMDGDSRTVGGIEIFLDFGDLRRSADLKCKNDRGDPLFESFNLVYDTKARKFAALFADHCGEPIEK